ncbi:probable aquaporin NIP7-1 [Cyclospora cayetanensis]|uniref:Probable aquaporin NIP7-1 n=1 Tax=Cyclospora cayetanensis TaxID=88456 RepID=A0A6P6RPI9_9EIME|nr:probable aquaporin NIP7-1 [Cyclospora cayetanensis]
MPSSESSAPPALGPPALSGVAGRLSSFPAPPGVFSQPIEAELQTQLSLSKQTPYQRLQSGISRGDTAILLGQRDFAATLNRPRCCLVSLLCTVAGGGIGPDGRASTVGPSAISQMFLPAPSSYDGSEFPAAEPHPDDNQEALSKRHVRMLYIIFCAQKFFCELLGTLFLVTSIALAEKGSHGTLSPFSVSAVVYVLTFLFVPISGAHFNPAVSTAMFLTSKQFHFFEYCSYFLCQLIGGTGGAIIGWAIMGEPLNILPLDPGASSARSIFHEVIPTILLIYTCLVLTFATSAGDVSLLTIPLTASMVVLFGAIAGATMNPAVATGIYMSHIIVGNYHVLTREILIGILCPFLGALLSVIGFVVTHAYTHPLELRFIHFT